MRDAVQSEEARVSDIRLNRCRLRGAIRFILYVVVLATFGCSADPSASPAHTADRIRMSQLLRLADNAFDPPRDWGAGVDRTPKPPADDAVIGTLFDYWASGDETYVATYGRPSATVRRRMTEAAVTRPEWLHALLSHADPAKEDLLDVTPEVLARFKAKHDEIDPADDPRELKKLLHDWLMRQGSFFRDELVKLAGELNSPDPRVQNLEYLTTLARLDWKTAEPIARRLMDSESSRVSIAAMGLVYTRQSSANHPEAPLLRERLKRIVRDEDAFDDVRRHAMFLLMDSDWPGRIEWRLSLLDTPSLQPDIVEGPPTVKQPALSTDEWTPRLIAQLHGKSPTVRESAVKWLLYLLHERPRADIVRALLPWIDNPDWVAVEGRWRVIEAAGDLQVYEAVPAILRALQQESRRDREAAVDALARLRPKSAVPALRSRSLEFSGYSEGTGGGLFGPPARFGYKSAMILCGAYTPTELADAIETHAHELAQKSNGLFATPNKEGALFGSTDTVHRPPEIDGEIAMKLLRDDNEVASILLNRVDRIRIDYPEAADRLTEYLYSCPVPAVEQDFVARLEQGRATEIDIGAALGRGDSPAGWMPGRLRTLASRNDTTAGVAAVLLRDQPRLRELLRHDSDAAAAVMVCALFAHVSLPLDDITARLTSRDLLVRQSAEAYLASDDSPAARAAIAARHPGDVLIFGTPSEWVVQTEFPRDWRIPPGMPATGGELRLLAEMNRADGPDEIFELYGMGHSMSPGTRVVTIRGNTASIRHDADGGRVLSRDLTDAELAELRRIVKQTRLDDQPGLDCTMLHGVWYAYTHLTRTTGRRTYMNNPRPTDPASAHAQFVAYLYHLTETGRMKVDYPAVAAKTPRFAVLGGNQNIAAFWKNPADPDDRRVLIDATEDRKAHWRRLAGNQIGPVTTPPDGFFDNAADGEKVDLGYWATLSSLGPAWQRKLVTDTVTLDVRDDKGIWRIGKGKEPVQIIKGKFERLLVCADGKWIVAIRPGEGDKPSRIVRINPTTGMIATDDPPIEAKGVPLAWIEPLGKVLIADVRGTNQNDGAEETGLLYDPETGKSTDVTGHFRPLRPMSLRPLQPTSRDGEVWAVISQWDSDKGTRTRIGRYNLRRFELTESFTFPGVELHSENVWVDEAEEHVYVAVNGDLVRLPLPRL